MKKISVSDNSLQSITPLCDQLATDPGASGGETAGASEGGSLPDGSTGEALETALLWEAEGTEGADVGIPDGDGEGEGGMTLLGVTAWCESGGSVTWLGN